MRISKGEYNILVLCTPHFYAIGVTCYEVGLRSSDMHVVALSFCVHLLHFLACVGVPKSYKGVHGSSDRLLGRVKKFDRSDIVIVRYERVDLFVSIAHFVHACFVISIAGHE